ncbi:MAG TPA: DUF3347 domain-containing protein [Chitinophagaceae bacterium]|nr:DUF3347 domain-containing protein [Chitinophagaceae bacterium]
MKRPLLAIIGIILAIIVVIGWKFIFPKKRGDNGPQLQGLTVSKHSSGFNESMSNAMNSYYALTESFVNWDTQKINTSLAELKTSIDSLRIQEMEKDSAIYPTVQGQWESIKAEIIGMQADTAIYEKRESLNMLSQQLFDLLRIVKYDGAKVFYQECPMALNNYESSAFWLSTEGDNKKRRNPYLGLHDPKYGKAMLTCGATRDSVNYVTNPAGN